MGLAKLNIEYFSNFIIGPKIFHQLVLIINQVVFVFLETSIFILFLYRLLLHTLKVRQSYFNLCNKDKIYSHNFEGI